MQFSEVISFTFLVDKHKPQNIITKKKPNNKYYLLYTGIIGKKLKTENEAKSFLYPDPQKQRQFTVLKQRFTQILSDVYLSFDFSETTIYYKSEYQKVLNRCFKNWAAGMILHEKGVKKISTEIFETVLRNSLKFDLIELSLFILKELKFHFGLLEDNKFKFKTYSKKYLEIKQLYDFKEEAEDLYLKLGQLVTKSKSYEYNENVKNLELRVLNLLAMVEEIDSFFTKYYAYNAVYFISLIKKDIENQILICKKALKYFNSKKQFKKIGLFSFTQKAGISYLSIKDYQKASEYLLECMKFKLPQTSISWLYVRSYLFQLHILRKDYLSAYNITSDVTNNKSFNKINETYREPWYLKEAFIHFLIKIGKINPRESDAQKLRPFRLSRFMNEVSMFSNDKRGLNITINIIQMLFYIVDERFDDALDKLSSLRQYNFRYLKRPEYARSSNFIKMLLKIPEGDYEPKKIRAKAQKYHQALLDNPSDYSEHALSIEIIPYEQLWEEIMSIF